MNQFTETANELVARHGYTGAIRIAKNRQAYAISMVMKATYAFWSNVLKELEGVYA